MPPNDTCLYITFSNAKEVYTPGSVIEGIAHVILAEPTKARSLKITLDGRAYTTWEVSRTRSVTEADGSSRSESYSESYSAKVIYADDKVVAWSSADGAMEVFPPGSYQYPFTFKLPQDLPPSFEASYGYIRYMVKIELDRPWYRINKRDNKVFTVVPEFDLNTISQAILPAKELKVKKLGIILFRHGEVTVECEIARGGFVPGEMIVVSTRVINDSSKDIVKAQLKLIEVSNYVAYSISKTLEPSSPFIDKASGDNRQRQRRKLATGEQEIHIAKRSKGNVELYLQVPSTVPSFECPIIRVEYFVEVKFESTGSLNSNIDASIPIVIGTIPVRSNASPDGASLPSTSGPCAPEMDSPPPYTEGDGVQPPSYKESVNGVDGTTVDKDSIEPFVPRYPFYPQLSEDRKKERNDGT